jgi:hypothetical protein
MANSAGMANSFKFECMMGYHQLGAPTLTSRTSLTAPTNDTVKAALYLSSATTGPTNTAYTATGEVSGTGYTAGGVSVTNATAPQLQTTTGVWDASADIVFTSTAAIGPTDCVMLYNSTQGNRNISVYTFAAQTFNGTLTLTRPATGASTSMLRIA